MSILTKNFEVGRFLIKKAIDSISKKDKGRKSTTDVVDFLRASLWPEKYHFLVGKKGFYGNTFHLNRCRAMKGEFIRRSIVKKFYVHRLVRTTILTNFHFIFQSFFIGRL